MSAPTATAGESGAPSAEPTGGSEPTAEESQDPGTSDEGAVQAEAVDAILSDSRGARSGLAPALTSLRACEETEDSVATVQRVTQARRDQVERAQGLAVDAMSEGDQVKNLLMTALKASLDADEHFLTWAQRRSGDCESDWSDDPDYNQGLSFSTKATAAKKQFVEAWNPLAEELGLSTRAPHEI